jgi:hypothetical protein
VKPTSPLAIAVAAFVISILAISLAVAALMLAATVAHDRAVLWRQAHPCQAMVVHRDFSGRVVWEAKCKTV